jgi:hypothetical protein
MTGERTKNPDDPDELTEAALLSLPDSLPAVLQARRADALRRRNAEELAREMIGFFAGSRRLIAHSPQEQEQEKERERRALSRKLAEEEEAQREFHEREEKFLERLAEAEAEIDCRRNALHARAIRLRDGRTAYVDGDGYRDGQGRELSGDDAAEARTAHKANPRAATWQDHQEIEKEWQEIRALRQRVESAEEGRDLKKATGTLAAAEVEFHEKVESRLGGMNGGVPNYGSGDYKSRLSGLSAEFSQTSNNKGFIVSRETTKKAPQPQRPSADRQFSV